VKNRSVSSPKLLFVAVLIVGSFFGGFLTFERHVQLARIGEDLAAQRETIVHGLEFRAPRDLNGLARRDWANNEYQSLYRWNVTDPFRWVYFFWLLVFSFFAIAITVMFRKQKNNQIKDFRKRPIAGNQQEFDIA